MLEPLSEPQPSASQVREEQRRLKEESEETRRRFADTRASVRETWKRLARERDGAAPDRELRHAALNLLEDTELARASEEKQTARREHAEASERESEARYRTLFDSIDEGFCTIEVIFDEQDKAVDYRILETNPAFLRQTGLEDAVGKTMRELIPHLDEFWFETYGHIARSGEALRFEHEIAPMGRFYDVYAFRVGEGNRVAVLFHDISERKNAEKALRARTDELETLLNALPAFVWITKDAGCEVIVGNPAANELTQTEPGTNVSQTAAAHGAGVYIRQLKEDGTEYRPEELPMQRAIATNAPVHDAQLDFRFADGRRVLTQGSAVPLLDENGRPRGAISVFLDVTKSRRLEDELRAAELNARCLAEVSQALVELNEIGKIMQAVGAKLGAHLGLSLVNFVDVNEAADEVVVTHAWHRPDVPSSLGTYRLAEYLSEEYQATLRAGKPFLVHDTATDPRADAARFAALKMGAFACTPLVRNGRWHFVLSIHHSTPHDWQPTEIELTREVTARLWTRLERLRFEAALHASEAQLRLIADTAPVFIAHCDRECRFKFMNEPYAARFGLRREEVIGKLLAEVVGQVAYESIRPHIERVLAGETIGFEMAIPYEKLGAHHMGCAYAPERNAAGEVVGLVAVVQDITERKAAEEVLARSLRETEQARAEAEAAGRAKDHFLAVLSHELRTPLTPVLLTAQMLATEDDLPRHVLAAFRMIERNVSLEAQFIDELLDVTRIARGKFELSRRPMDINQALRAAADVAAPDIKAKSQSLICELKADATEFSGDFKCLQQAFWNLLKNAAKFTPEHGLVTARSRNEPGSPDAPAAFIVEITDSGIGFDADAGAKIFEPFTQANQSITKQFGGLGLGLAISKATIEAHGGSIWAASPGAGKGATFTVRLPLGADA